MVPKFSKKKDAVIDFVKFLLRDQSQEIFYANAGFLPVVSSFYTDTACLRKYPEIPWIKERMLSGVHRPPKKDYTNYSKIMAHYILLAMRREMPVEEALRSMDQAIQSEKTLVVKR
jgi:multiple sugar transport system substrate-binding protein